MGSRTFRDYYHVQNNSDPYLGAIEYQQDVATVEKRGRRLSKRPQATNLELFNAFVHEAFIV
mgnify:FL=1